MNWTGKSARDILTDIKGARDQLDLMWSRDRDPLHSEVMYSDVAGALKQIGYRNPFSGVQIIENVMMVKDSTKPRRVHTRRRWMSAAYHLRVQKKWVKRFGYAPEYLAMFVNPKAAGLPGSPYLCVHPVIAQQLRANSGARS